MLPLLIPRLPAKGPNAILFFVAFPAIAFFLLYGGGLKGFGVSWTAGFLSGFNDSIGEGGRKVVSASETTAVIGPLLWGLGRLIVLISTAISWVLWPLTWLRDRIQATDSPVWVDLAATAAIVLALLVWLTRGLRSGPRPLVTCLGIFAGIGIVIAAMGLRPRRFAGGRHAALGRPPGDACRVGGRHRRLNAGRYCTGARAAG